MMCWQTYHEPILSIPSRDVIKHPVVCSLHHPLILLMSNFYSIFSPRLRRLNVPAVAMEMIQCHCCCVLINWMTLVVVMGVSVITRGSHSLVINWWSPVMFSRRHISPHRASVGSLYSPWSLLDMIATLAHFGNHAEKSRAECSNIETQDLIRAMLVYIRVRGFRIQFVWSGILYQYLLLETDLVIEQSWVYKWFRWFLAG